MNQEHDPQIRFTPRAMTFSFAGGMLSTNVCTGLHRVCQMKS